MNRFLLLLIWAVFSISAANASVVKGTVCSSEDTNPIIGAAVEAKVDSLPSVSVKTSNKGGFSLSVSDGAERCVITISSDGYQPHTLTIMNVSEDVDLERISLLPNVSTLDEVAVTTSRVIDLPNKSIIFPTQLEKDRAANPLNLLTQLSFSAPALSIDEYMKTITVDGRTPQILINGVKRTYSDFNALDPQNILKIEYITHTDMRYGAPYINILTVRPPTGGSFLAQLSAPVTTRQENHQIYTSYHRGKHEISVNYSGMFRDSRKEYSEATEQYFAPDKIYTIDIKGLPSSFLDHDQNASLEYSLTGGPKKMFIATASFRYHSYDRNVHQSATSANSSFLRNTFQQYHTYNPALNLYGSLPIAATGRLEMNLSATYQTGDYFRSLNQTNGYSDATTTDSRTYTIAGDLYYTHPFSWSDLSAGLSYNYTEASNNYLIPESQRQRLHKSSVSAYVALSGQISNILYYYAAAGLDHTKVEKGSTSPYAYLSLQKKLGNINLDYSFTTNSSSSGLSAYSDVILPVNEYLYRSGNLLLKDQLSIKNELAANYSYRKFSTRLTLNYEITTHPPITVWNYIDNTSDPIYGKFLETTLNSRRNDTYSAMLVAGFSNLLGHYSIKLMGSYKNMSTEGYGHQWKKAYFRTGGSAGAFFGPWQFIVAVYPLPSYSLNGNFLWRDVTSWYINASWHKGNWSVTCTLADLFAKKAYYQEKTTMAIGGLNDTRSWIADKNNWVAFTVRYQFNYGKQVDKPNRSINSYTRPDSGVNVNY